MSEFKVGGIYICTTAHYTYYKLFYRLTWGYNNYNNAVKKNSKINQTKEITQPKIKIELMTFGVQSETATIFKII